MFFLMIIFFEIGIREPMNLDIQMNFFSFLHELCDQKPVDLTYKQPPHQISNKKGSTIYLVTYLTCASLLELDFQTSPKNYDYLFFNY